MRSCEAANYGRRKLAHFGRGGDFLGARTRDQHVARSALLQKKLPELPEAYRAEAAQVLKAEPEILANEQRLLEQTEQLIRGPLQGGLPGQGRTGPLQLLGFTFLCAALYGAVLGSFGGVMGEHLLQVLISSVKVPLLLLATFVISLPSFFVMNTVLGVRSDFAVVFRALVSSQAGLTIVLAALGYGIYLIVNG